LGRHRNSGNASGDRRVVSGEREEAGHTPTGRLRKGFVRVAGVTTDEVRAELLWIALDQGITLSQAVGVALQEWLRGRRNGVSHPGGLPEPEEIPGRPPGGLHPVSESPEGRA
jgi:hypothetical protein